MKRRQNDPVQHCKPSWYLWRHHSRWQSQAFEGCMVFLEWRISRAGLQSTALGQCQPLQQNSPAQSLSSFINGRLSWLGKSIPLCIFQLMPSLPQVQDSQMLYDVSGYHRKKKSLKHILMKSQENTTMYQAVSSLMSTLMRPLTRLWVQRPACQSSVHKALYSTEGKELKMI